MLAATADDVIVPSYEALVASFDELDRGLDALCASPSPGALDAAREAWRTVCGGLAAHRAGGVGPAMERRLASPSPSLARGAVAELLGGHRPGRRGRRRRGRRGGEGHRRPRDRALRRGLRRAGHPGRARRCEYVSSVTRSPGRPSDEVLGDWTGGYRDEFVAGIDGDPQASLDMLVNEVIFRLTEIDDQGLRDMGEAARPTS